MAGGFLNRITGFLWISGLVLWSFALGHSTPFAGFGAAVTREALRVAEVADSGSCLGRVAPAPSVDSVVCAAQVERAVAAVAGERVAVALHDGQQRPLASA